MQPPPPLARSLYRWSAFLALPGGLWAAFEMYGLTLRGTQMLFFSIAHTMPPLVLAVFLSVPMGVAWLAQSIVALAHQGYRARLAVPRRPLFIFAVVILGHSALLFGYESWSVNAIARVPVCALGLVLTGLASYEAWRWLRSPIGAPSV